MLSQRRLCRKLITHHARHHILALLLQQCAAVCCSVLQCVAARPVERKLALRCECVVLLLQCVLQHIVLLLQRELALRCVPLLQLVALLLQLKLLLL